MPSMIILKDAENENLKKDTLFWAGGRKTEEKSRRAAAEEIGIR